ncbi:hypothetical protein [aff. Roholtiella sp. LEGE 12411]|uniref:hypothetical protein n=1 Tax=aff. Roholtiella sp. LEGE 12411 TaxID=1828822 RepID=UPI001880A62B|nr:hypothetical protein [aff. Roholtiella sp. LEGE 12411]MBE9036788.1 hypothetical protein [aff. Roholtiella sp. LEGE 12411]
MKRARKFFNNINADHYLFKRLAFSLLSLWFWWVVANLINVMIGQLSFFTMPMFGILQWLVLRKYIPHLGRWILASAYGWITAYLIIYVFKIGEKIVEIAPQGYLLILGVTVNIQGVWTYILIMFLASTVIGVFQWLVLRNHIRYAIWWIFASCIGGVAKGGAIALVLPIVDPTLVEVIGSLAYGTVTGIALIGLLKTRIQRHLEQQMYWS